MTTCRPTHLVGSVNLDTASDVMTLAAATLGASLRSIPDGETGGRLEWIGWQRHVLEQTPFLQPSGRGSADAYEGSVNGLSRYRVRGDLTDAHFPPLGYANAAIASYAVFTSLRDAGRIPSGVRFQVSLPTPLAPLAATIEPIDFLKVESLYENAMREEIEQICDAIPVHDLAIQWDVSVEVAILEGVAMQDGLDIFSNPMDDMAGRIAKVIDWIPGQAMAGFHLCYGDYDHKHFVEPEDLKVLVSMANGIFAAVSRKVDWLHLPVPITRDDDAFYAPLEKLALPAETQLYLGLVHLTDGEEGGKRRIAAATRHISNFGIATECGLGRRPPETIPAVMNLTATLASA
jgi:hypothetical protein